MGTCFTNTNENSNSIEQLIDYKSTLAYWGLNGHNKVLFSLLSAKKIVFEKFPIIPKNPNENIKYLKKTRKILIFLKGIYKNCFLQENQYIVLSWKRLSIMNRILFHYLINFSIISDDEKEITPLLISDLIKKDIFGYDCYEEIDWTLQVLDFSTFPGSTQEWFLRKYYEWNKKYNNQKKKILNCNHNYS